MMAFSATCFIEAFISSIELDVVSTEWERLSMLSATCSMDAAISITEPDVVSVSSKRKLIESATSVMEACISVKDDAVVSVDDACSSTPSLIATDEVESLSATMVTLSETTLTHCLMMRTGSR